MRAMKQPQKRILSWRLFIFVRSVAPQYTCPTPQCQRQFHKTHRIKDETGTKKPGQARRGGERGPGNFRIWYSSRFMKNIGPPLYQRQGPKSILLIKDQCATQATSKVI